MKEARVHRDGDQGRSIDAERQKAMRDGRAVRQAAARKRSRSCRGSAAAWCCCGAALAAHTPNTVDSDAAAQAKGRHSMKHAYACVPSRASVTSVTICMAAFAARWYLDAASLRHLGASPMSGCSSITRPQIPLLFNWTPSLPYRVAWLQTVKRDFARGDYVVFSFAGTAGESHYPGLGARRSSRSSRALPGDRVTVDGSRGVRQRRARRGCKAAHFRWAASRAHRRRGDRRRAISTCREPTRTASIPGIGRVAWFAATRSSARRSRLLA